MTGSTALRVVFFGTPEIACPTLEALIEGPHEVVGVVSQPDRGRGRGRKLSPSPVSKIAIRDSIALLRPDKVGDTETVETLAGLQPDVGVVVAFGQFIPKKVRELPSRGYLINAHASLLPRFRGAAPIARAVLAGERETGISVMRVEKEMDAGPVALVTRTPISERENTAELSARLADLAAEVIGETLDRIADGLVEWAEQDADGATFAAKLEKRDSVLDLRESARALAARIHAVSPKPGGAITLVSPDGVETVLKVSRAATTPFGDDQAPEPGRIVRDSEQSGLSIATGEGWLLPLVLQRPGGKALSVDDFLRGFEIAADARFALVERVESHGTETA